MRLALWATWLLQSFAFELPGLAWETTTKGTKYVRLEMYAVGKSTEDFSQPGNLDLYDAAGLVNFLATQVVLETGLAPDRASRPNGIDTVVKYQIRIHNNMSSSDVDVQAEFSKFVRFEDGAVVAPEDVEIFERSGDLVGALSFHPPNGDVRFPLEETYYWFSLSGPCPNMKNGEKSSSNCSKYQKGLVPDKKSQYVAGGLCKPKLFSSDIPDGTPGCSYYIENYTTKNFDEIAGITQEDCGGRKCSSWSDFRLHCSNQNLSFTHLGVKYCKEYDYPGCITSCQDAACGSGEVGIPFWTGRCNASRNALRASLLERAFGGSQVPSFYGSNPRCDQYSPMCNKPAPDAGVSYCHRDASGVCDACHIPGTVRAVSPPSQVACRVDLFLNKELPQYKDFLPQCDTECGGECSTESASSACCVYIGKCKRTWKAESWGICNASCGNGTRFRQVWCPFEEIFGPCDESSKPENSTKCRGDACPWSKDHFGNWSQCNNTCGAGSEVQGLICECPDHCPGKEKECAKSPKPKAPSRPCFNSTSKDEFCSSCAADKQCSNCTKGFDLKDGTCHGSKRLALVNYELRAFNLSDACDGWLSSAFVPAFKDTIQKTTNASLDVLNLSMSSSIWIRKLRETTHKGKWTVVDVRLSAFGEDDDKSLKMLIQQLNQSDLNGSAVDFSKFLVKHGCTAAHACQVPQNLSLQLKQIQASCPEGQSWNDGDCAWPPSPPAKAGGFPMWLVALIVVVILLIAAAVTWSCVCKRRSSNEARLLGA